MLTESEIKRFIDDYNSSERRQFAALGQRYYEGDHDIKKYKMYYYNADGKLMEDNTRANCKISHPFFTELVDQLAAYMLSFEENPIQAKPKAEGLQEYLDTYFDDDFWAEIQELITGTNAKGYEYLYAYQRKDDRIGFQCADSMGVVEVREQDTDDHCSYVIYWYVDRIEKGRKLIKRIQVHTANEIHYFVQANNGKIKPDTDAPLNPRPSVVWTEKDGKKYGKGFGFIPFWRLDNNRKQFSGLKPIKALIDDYDLMSCGLSNNLVDFDTPIHVVAGFQGHDLDELVTNIKTKKVVGVDADGGLDVKTVDIPYAARKEKLEIDEKNIYRFGMGLNTSGLKDTTATTNLAIKAAYSLLDLKANKLTMRLKRFLRPIIKVVLDEINAKNKTDYKVSDVTIHFEHIIPTNESENAQNEFVLSQAEQMRVNTVLQAATVLGDEQVLRSLCDILDLDFDKLQANIAERQEVQNFLGAEAVLQGVVTDEI